MAEAIAVDLFRRRCIVLGVTDRGVGVGLSSIAVMLKVGLTTVLLIGLVTGLDVVVTMLARSVYLNRLLCF